MENDEVDDFELQKMRDRFPTAPLYEVDIELIERRLQMTVAERIETHYKARRLLERAESWARSGSAAP